MGGDEYNPYWDGKSATTIETKILHIPIEKVFVLLGYDEDWYTFETFMGVFSTKEKAEEVKNNDFTMYDDEKVFEHQWYEILEIPIDKAR